MTNEEKAEEIANKNNIFGKFIMYRIKATCLEMAQWKDENPIITANLFRQCISMLNDVCYEQGTGVDETDVEYVIKVKKLP